MVSILWQKLQQSLVLKKEFFYLLWKLVVPYLIQGNLQKFVIGREILQNPKVFIVNQPTWGVDAAAAAFIRQALLELAEGGAGVLVISQDLDELMEISDSFMVLSEGQISTPRPAKGITIEAIGLMMGGTKVA